MNYKSKSTFRKYGARRSSPYADDPFVESGNKWMGFYWKDGKDQLMARSGDLPPSASTPGHASTLSGNPWTSFTMNMRDPSVLEGPLDLARFLVTSLSFTRSIKQVDMVVDDIPVLEVSKTVKGKERVGVKGMRDTSTGGMMKVKSVDATGMVITAKVTQWLAGAALPHHGIQNLLIASSIRLHPSSASRPGSGNRETHKSFCLFPHIILLRPTDPYARSDTPSSSADSTWRRG